MIMNATFANGEILKKTILQKDEHIELGGNALSKCYLYDSSNQNYVELTDYEVARTARRKFFLLGEKRSRREVYFVSLRENKVILCFDCHRSQRNSQGFWVCMRYEVEFTLRVTNPIKIIQQNVQNVNLLISSNQREIQTLVYRCKTGGELRTLLDERFKAKGLSLTYVNVRVEEITSQEHLTTEQRRENDRTSSLMEEYHKNKITEIRKSGEREQQKKDAMSQIDIDKCKLNLKYTEKQVLLNIMLETIQRLEMSNKERARGMAMLSSILGVELPPHVLQLLKRTKSKRNSYINLP